MKVFTIENDGVRAGAEADTHEVAGVRFAALVVGEEGRGRTLAALPVKGLKPGATLDHVARDARGTLVAEDDGDDEQALVVLRSGYGFRGSNRHEGDRVAGWYTLKEVWTFNGYLRPEEVEALSGPLNRREAEAVSAWLWAMRHTDPCPTPTVCCEFHTAHARFPGEVLARGLKADGLAGNMADGEQLLAIVRQGQVFSLYRSGRLYGEPARFYYVFDGATVHAVTWKERQALEALGLSPYPEMVRAD